MISKSAKVAIDDLQEEVKNKLNNGAVYLTQPANNSLITIKALKETDFISIYWIQDLTRLILIRNEDYSISPVEDGGINIELEPDWIADDAKIYIEGVSLGL